MTEPKKLIEYYPNFSSLKNGFFSCMQNPPWDGVYDPQFLDIHFFQMYGQRYAGNLVEWYFDIATALPEQTKRDDIAALILAEFKTAWEHKFELLKLEYNPIENYSMTEDGQDTHDDTRTPDITHTMTRTPNITNTQEIINRTQNSENKMYGFNSDLGANDSSRIDTENGTITNKESGDELTDTKESGTEQTKGQSTHRLTRSGNIGVTTSQQMAESEINLWDWNFILGVFRDCAERLTLKIYE